MSDLISRKALLEDIKKYVSGTPLQEMFETIVDNQPTAYDMDKVLEQLKESDLLIDQEWCITVEDAVKIVKGGLEE